MFCNKLFHVSHEILNAWSAEIMFLWNFCHLFPVLFYEWTIDINDSLRFLGFFLGIISWRRTLLFNVGGGGRGGGGASFLIFLHGAGGSKKSWDGEHPPHAFSTIGNPDISFNEVFIITTIFNFYSKKSSSYNSVRRKC